MRARPNLTGAPTKAVENAPGERAVIMIKMMAASGADDIGLALSQEERACAVVLIGTIKALDHGRVDRRERRLSRQRILAGWQTKPAGDPDLEIGRGADAEKRQLNDAHLRFGRQVVIGEGKNIRAEGIADQRDLGCAPSRHIGVDDGAEVASSLFGRLLAPEVAQAVPADDGNALRPQLLADGLVEIAPTAIAGEDDRQQRPARSAGNSTKGRSAMPAVDAPQADAKCRRSNAANVFAAPPAAPDNVDGRSSGLQAAMR